MKRRRNTRYCILILVWAGCMQAYAEPFARGPYLGQTPPGSTAQIFAPGLICQPGYRRWESNGTFSAGGKVFCYSRRGSVYITENTDRGWTRARRTTLSAATV